MGYCRGCAYLRHSGFACDARKLRQAAGTASNSNPSEGGLAPDSAGDVNATSVGLEEFSEQQINDVIAALKPLQVMLGKWSGKTRLDYDGFKAVDEHEWIWDLQSNPVQPALKINY